MSSNTNTSRGGIGLAGAMFLIFLTLKLVGVPPVASWSWWWVTAPLWGACLLALAIFLIGVCIWFVWTFWNGK